MPGSEDKDGRFEQKGNNHLEEPIDVDYVVKKVDFDNDNSGNNVGNEQPNQSNQPYLPNQSGINPNQPRQQQNPQYQQNQYQASNPQYQQPNQQNNQQQYQQNQQYSQNQQQYQQSNQQNNQQQYQQNQQYSQNQQQYQQYNQNQQQYQQSNQQQNQQYTNQTPNGQPTAPIYKKSKLLALIFNFVIPGLGHCYVGNWSKGIIIFAAYCIFFLLGIFLLFPFIIAILIWAYGLFDVYRQADLYNKGYKV